MGRVCGYRDTVWGWNQIGGRLVDDRPAYIHVVEVHVRRRVEPDVGHLVVDREATFAHPRLDPAPQLDGLSEHRRLPHDALGVQDTFVAFPPLAVTGEARGDEADPPMQAVLLGRPDELMELRGVIDPAEERVVEAAGDDHAAAPAAKPSQAHRFRVPRTDHAGWRQPRKRLASQLTSSNVHRSIHEHVEAESRARPELEHTNPALDAIAERHESYACNLFEAADPAHQIAPGHRRPVDQGQWRLLA